jgi:nucleoside-diphosphate kinase
VEADDRYNPPQSIEKTCMSEARGMAIERTLSIIKPDATARNVTGDINAVIEKAGLRIIAQKRICWTLPQAQRFYAEHKERPFYDELCAFMTSGPIVVQVLEGDDAIARYRKVMGATDPEEAKRGTIRKRFALSKSQNSVHGSDSPASAAREIALNFQPDEIVG